jgi:hypothetical protein
MSNARTEVEMLAEGLGMDEQRTGLLCPFCNGGRSHETTFSVKRISDGVLHNCHRASCDAGRGFVPTAGYLLDAPNRAPMAREIPTHYTGSFEPLTSTDLEYFEDRFDLTDPEVLKAIGINGRWQHVMEVRNPRGLARGYVVRRGGWSGTPASPRTVAPGIKTKVYMNDSQQIPISWHMREYHFPEKVVIVEDQLSAMKVAQAGFVGVALMGTHLEAGRVREIAMQSQASEVIIALDNDASAVAFRMARDWGLAFKQVRVVMLERDLKDVSRQQVWEVIE